MERFVGGVLKDKILRYAQNDSALKHAGNAGIVILRWTV